MFSNGGVTPELNSSPPLLRGLLAEMHADGRIHVDSESGETTVTHEEHVVEAYLGNLAATNGCGYRGEISDPTPDGETAR